MYFNKQLYAYRDDYNVPKFDDLGSICVMDALCSLCAHGAKWIARNDSAAEFKIIPLQSELGSALMTHFEMNPNDPTSWLYLEDGKAFTSMDALIRVGCRLGGIWYAFGMLRIIPRKVRDILYRKVAMNRYRWFGSTDLCALPHADVQKRLLK